MAILITDIGEGQRVSEIVGQHLPEAVNRFKR